MKTEKAGNKLFEGSVIVAGEKAIIRQGSFDRTVAKADLVYIAETKDEVYQHLLSKVPAKDVAAVGRAFFGMAQDARGRDILHAASQQVGLTSDANFVSSDGSEYDAYRMFYRTAPPQVR